MASQNLGVLRGLVAERICRSFRVHKSVAKPNTYARSFANRIIDAKKEYKKLPSPFA